MHQRNNHKTAGFTLIELMLAMSFVAALLIAIALLTIQISNIYTKGVTLRQVNEAGLAISSDMQRAIQGADAFAVPDGTSDNESYVTNDTGGRLCLGTYSYVWNFGEFIVQDPDRLSNKFSNDNAAFTDKVIRLVKVSDADKSLCRADESNYPAVPTDHNAVELLAIGDRDLAVQGFSLSGSKTRGLYSVSLTIGTNNRDALIDDTNCKAPDQEESDQDYCAVNKFDIVARTANTADEDDE